MVAFHRGGNRSGGCIAFSPVHCLTGRSTPLFCFDPLVAYNSGRFCSSWWQTALDSGQRLPIDATGNATTLHHKTGLGLCGPASLWRYSSFGSFLFRCFSLIRILFLLIKFTITGFLICASSSPLSPVISLCSIRAFCQSQLKLTR